MKKLHKRRGADVSFFNWEKLNDFNLITAELRSKFDIACSFPDSKGFLRLFNSHNSFSIFNFNFFYLSRFQKPDDKFFWVIYKFYEIYLFSIKKWKHGINSISFMTYENSHRINALVIRRNQNFCFFTGNSSYLLNSYNSFFKFRNNFFQNSCHIITACLCDFKRNSSGFFADFFQENEDFLS